MVKLRPTSAGTERIGVAEVERIINADLQWIFREQRGDDYGIDAHIEVVDSGEVTGRLIAAQIKSGSSYFHPTDGGWWFYPDANDLQYWHEHALPVIVVCFNPETATAYWQVVDAPALRDTRTGGQKLFIPATRVLGSESAKELRQVAAGSPYELRLRRLRLALPWMVELQQGHRLTLNAREWVNKSSGLGDISVVSIAADGGSETVLGEWTIRPGTTPYVEVLPTLVPWADLSLHDETYAEAERQAQEGADVLYDGDGYPLFDQSYDDWVQQFAGDRLRPYVNRAGEVEDWRLEMRLNQLGLGFLAVHEFADGNRPFLAPKRS
ncbi:DUF4365 domain-containing protein [Curtobacterium flaccumfaciens]|uniref:DUF4365 domain-containing protein n=1 Tax=Curtobacterium flaccumfaciens TaxID=2035 RepID=UPI003993159E